MATLSGPLLSFGATGSIGDSVTYTDRKRQHIAKSHAVPANPNTAAQAAQRGFVSAASSAIQAAKIFPVVPLNQRDITALTLLCKVERRTCSWFNRACSIYIDSLVAGNTPAVLHGEEHTPGVGDVGAAVYSSLIDGANFTSGYALWGLKPGTLINTKALSIFPATNKAVFYKDGLASGVPIYFRFFASNGIPCEGVSSGIYTATPL